MKHIFTILLLFIGIFKLNSQTTRIAILDFDNISGISKYDGLGKAMSSMLISDIESNVSPKRLQLVERSQIQKILKEQSFQASNSVNKNTAVQTGKLLGVNFLLVGDVYILNDQLLINARLINVETGDIIFSKKQDGKIITWLALKTNIANEISSNLKVPLESKSLNSKPISESSLLLYANGINYLDKNEIDSADILLTELKYTETEFNYTNSQLDQLFEMAIKKNTNNTLKQKAYILNLHKRISKNPIEAWQQIETFWDGPLDDKYPYLEYLFLKNIFEIYKKDSVWLNFLVSRHGVRTQLGDMLLYSISSHASRSNEIKSAINYNTIREKMFPFSEMSIIQGEPIHPSKYRYGLIDDPNKDTIYYKYLALAQNAIIFGLGSRNEKKMKSYLYSLEPLLDMQFYSFIPTEYYYEIANKQLPIFNPYDVLGTLIVLIGDDKMKAKASNYFKRHEQEVMYTGLLKDQAWYKGNLENNMLLKNCMTWNSSSFDDYKNKNWTKDDFSSILIAKLCSITMESITLQTLNKYSESYELLSKTYAIASNNTSIWNEFIWSGLTLQQVYLIVQIKNSVKLGKIEDVKYLGKQLHLIGIDPGDYLSLHTELYF